MGSLEFGCPHSKPIPVTLCCVILDTLLTLPEHVSSSGIVLISSVCCENEMKYLEGELSPLHPIEVPGYDAQCH